MKSSIVFINESCAQAICIPKEYHFDTQEVWIEKVAEGLLIRPKPASWDDFFFKTPRLTDDFSTERNQQKPRKSEDF